MNKVIAHPTTEIVVWINLASLLSFACFEEDAKPLMLGFLVFKLQLPSLRHNKRNLIPRTAHLNKKTLRGVKQEEGTTKAGFTFCEALGPNQPRGPLLAIFT